MANRKERLQKAKSYALYYGYGRAQELTGFDLAVIEPDGMSIEDIVYMRSKGTLILGYVSCMEVRKDTAAFMKLTEEDWLRVEGKPYDTEFGSRWVRFDSSHWLTELRRRIHHLINEMKVDGLFLDTIGNIESSQLVEQIRNQQLNAIINWIRELRQQYPDHLMIQNNGLELLCQYTAPYIDGLCWENPPLSLPECREWNQWIIERLVDRRRNWGHQILILLEDSIERKRNARVAAQELAHTEDFLFYSAPDQYVEGINPL